MRASRTFAAVLAPTALAAHAHEGHGLPGVSHWHASDTLGWIVVALIVVIALVWRRRK